MRSTIGVIDWQGNLRRLGDRRLRLRVLRRLSTAVRSAVETTFCIAALAGCASPAPQPKTAELAQLRRATAQLSSDLMRARAEVASLATTNRELAERLRLTVPARVSLDVIDDGPSTTEHFLYSKALASFHAKDAASLAKSKQLLLKSFPDSPFADNAAYLEARMAADAGDLARALRLYEALLLQYPAGNKAPAAMRAQAEIFKEMKKHAKAREIFSALRTRYPGSPESMRE